MATSPAKENILRKIRQALASPVPLPFPAAEQSTSVFTPPSTDLVIQFAETFTGIQGKFAFCKNDEELFQQVLDLCKTRNWNKVFTNELKIKNDLTSLGITIYNDLESCDVSLTGCEYLVARTGSMVLSTANPSGRTVSIYAPVHICIAYASQVVFDVKDALGLLKEKYGNNNMPSFISFASGPSRTADIEKTLVTGVHGPGEVYCFLVENSN